MSEISAQLVKELRERTGAGMMECKKALVATAGDIEKAVDEMRKAGQAKADKKASRIAAEGIVAISLAQDGKSAALVEVNCETDFVARDQHFVEFVGKVAGTVLAHHQTDMSPLAEVVLENGQSLDVLRKELITKIGENISLRRAACYENAHAIGTYVHGGRIGVMVELEGGDAALAKDIAMHIAAANPMVIAEGELSPAVLAREKEIYLAQIAESGKPQDIMEKMIEGRMRKFLAEVSLVGQAFVKDPSITVADLLKKNKATVVRFVRFVVGEGIEKQETDFVAEVLAAQAASK